MTLLSKPSRSYANVEHDVDGLGGVGTGTYKSERDQAKKPSKKGDGFKTYRPPISETHLRRTLGYDPHPTSHFAPLPSAFQSHRVKKEQALAGQRAEADHLLSTQSRLYDESSSAAAPRRTAGGFAGYSGHHAGHAPNGLKASGSVASFSGPPGARGGVYMDSSGKLHDTEYDPFGGVADMTRAKSKRRSAFGSDRRRHDSSSSSSSGSEDGDYRRPSMDQRPRDRERDEEEVRRKLQMDRQRMDDVTSYVARRRSVISEREQPGQGTPSIRSSDDYPSAQSFATAPSTGYGVGGRGGSKSQQAHYYPSPLSPSFASHVPQSTLLPARTPTTSNSMPSNGEGTPPEKATEMTHKNSLLPKSPLPPPREAEVLEEKKKSKVEVKDGITKITGFDGPLRPSPIEPTEGMSNLRLHSPSPSYVHALTPPIPPSANLSSSTRSSADLGRTRSPRPLDHRRAHREDIYPETPAQTKRRQEREQRRLASGGRPLAINTDLASLTAGGDGRGGRVLPEIEIVEDDDPRIVFPKEGGKTTRITKPRLGFPTHSNHARKLSSNSHSTLPSPPSFSNIDRPRSLTGSAKQSSMSGAIDEGGGYLPSRWASGDRHLRLNEAEREAYRPREWASTTAESAGSGAGGGALVGGEWHPGPKDQIKRNFKDIATSARFSLYRTKKKLLRKAEM